jgi:hypothetical protein
VKAYRDEIALRLSAITAQPKVLCFVPAFIPGMTASRNPRLQPKSAFSRLPLVHKANLEGQQRVECGPSPSE